jgi:outer membrane protein TolC
MAFLWLILNTMVPGVVWANDTMSLSQFIERAQQNNLSLLRQKSRLQEADARAQGWRLPSPKLGLTQMNMAGGDQARGWEVSQSLPFPDKIRGDYQARQHAKNSVESDLLSTNLAVLAEARWLYFQVWKAQEVENILREKKQLLQKHGQMAQNLARSNTFAKIHWLKVNFEIDQVDVDIQAARLLRQQRQVEAAQYINDRPGQFWLVASEPPMTSMPTKQKIDVKQTPQLKARHYDLLNFQSQERVNNQSWFPDFDLRYNYMQQGAMFPEFQQFTVGISLPFVFFWQARSEQSQAKSKRVQAQLTMQLEERVVQAEVLKAQLSLESLKEQMDILKQRTLPRVRQRQSLFRNLAPRDLSSLQEHLDTALALPNLQMQILEQRQQWEEAWYGLSQYREDLKASLTSDSRSANLEHSGGIPTSINLSKEDW